MFDPLIQSILCRNILGENNIFALLMQKVMMLTLFFHWIKVLNLTYFWYFFVCNVKIEAVWMLNQSTLSIALSAFEKLSGFVPQLSKSM